MENVLSSSHLPPFLPSTLLPPYSTPRQWSSSSPFFLSSAIFLIANGLSAPAGGEEVIFRDPICTPWAYGGGLLVPRLFPDPQGIWPRYMIPLSTSTPLYLFIYSMYLGGTPINLRRNPPERTRRGRKV